MDAEYGEEGVRGGEGRAGAGGERVHTNRMLVVVVVLAANAATAVLPFGQPSQFRPGECHGQLIAGSISSRLSSPTAASAGLLFRLS